jgi:hypothetical protein
MKRTAFLLTALLLSLAFREAQAASAPQGSKRLPPLPYVVVDPNDLRKPIPDPEQGLTEKYDGKVVRFTGVARRWSLDKTAGKVTFELHHDIVKIVKAKGKKPAAVREETIVVPVTFQGDERQLRARKAGFSITVEGKASVMTDGTLIITDAVIVPAVLAPPGGPDVRPLPKKDGAPREGAPVIR